MRGERDFMHDRPMISVVMPLYDCETLVGKSIESVIRQSYSNWELIIVDDCSKDNSYEVARSYAKKDERIRLLRMQQNSGVALARNTAIHEARGEILMYLDSDDIWSPYKMEIQSKYMRESQIVFSCSAYEVIDENGIPKGKVVNMLPSVDYKGFLLNNLIQIVGVAIDLNKISKELLMEDKDMKSLFWWSAA